MCLCIFQVSYFVVRLNEKWVFKRLAYNIFELRERELKFWGLHCRRFLHRRYLFIALCIEFQAGGLCQLNSAVPSNWHLVLAVAAIRFRPFGDIMQQG